MSISLETTFVLIGPLAGRTITLGSQGYPFKKGKFTLTAVPEEMALHARLLERNWQAYPENHPKVREYNHGKRNTETQTQSDAQSTVPSDVQPSGGGPEPGSETDDSNGTTSDPSGTTGDLSEGDGHAPQLTGVEAYIQAQNEKVDSPADVKPTEPTLQLNQKLLKAVSKLDPADDNHWTQDGKPAMKAVEGLYGSTDIKRSDIEAVAPGFVRKDAPLVL